ncbi:methyltransferase domain-containing protein [Lewinella sp. IMCC34191]|uniref:methyltransferase domain-containing protein n=1 Tax=Lewinella sp. IMCC34191 TaxID=2259172 RepID=UPI000E289D57|nr:methyltransferase domain-containing protein [Lewinella sp. IMCC34191]
MDGLKLYSPLNGERLHPNADGLLDDGERLWPVVDGIPWLRPKEELRQRVIEVLQHGRRDEALKLLLADQDDFSPTPPPNEDALTELLRNSNLNLRKAMTALNYGPVGKYFAYRWCSPTFRSGLYLLEHSVPKGGVVVEVACGIGHFLRELESNGVTTVGMDIVFSKLWLARRYMGVRGPLVCGDVSQGPLSVAKGGCTVFCHDAFYFFPEKEQALRRMRTLAGPGGRLAVGHVHTTAERHAAGYRLDTPLYATMAAGPVYDDASVAAAWYAGSDLLPAGDDSPAVSWIEGHAVKDPIRFSAPDTYTRSPVLADSNLPAPPAEWWAEYEMDAKAIPVPVPGRATVTSAGRIVAAGAQVEELSREQDYRQGYSINLPDKW